MAWNVTGGSGVDTNPDEDAGAAYKLPLEQLGNSAVSTIVFVDGAMCSESAAIAAISEHLHLARPPRRMLVDREGNVTISEP